MTSKNADMEINHELINQRMTLLLQVLQQTMSTTKIAIGFDLENKKLVLIDVETNCLSRVDLEQLNSIFVEEVKQD